MCKIYSKQLINPIFKVKSGDQIKVQKNLMVDLLGIIISDCACTFGTEYLDYNYGRAGASLRK